MRIVLFGNTNNYPFVLASAIRKLEHDVLLFVNRKELLHRPESMIPEYASSYPPWISDVSDIEENNFIEVNNKIKNILDTMSSSDGLILNHTGPSLLEFVKKPSIALLTGSDLDYYANFSTLGQRQICWDKDFLSSHEGRQNTLLWAEFIQRQRLGISMAKAVNYFPRGLNPAGDALLDEIGVSDERRIFFYMANLFMLDKWKSMRNERIRIFCGTRLTWKKPMKPGTCPLDYKGTDIMIKGLGLFLKRHLAPISIYIVKKGLDIYETQELAKDEGIEPFITWLDEMSLENFYKELEVADIVFEQLNGSCVGLAGLDAMAMGKPVIANGRPEIFNKEFGRPLPVCQARTTEEVYEQLVRLINDKEYRIKVGDESYHYIKNFLSPEYYAKKCIEILLG